MGSVCSSRCALDVGLRNVELAHQLLDGKGALPLGRLAVILALHGGSERNSNISRHQTTEAALSGEAETAERIKKSPVALDMRLLIKQ
jgi:hypothetical protein